MEPKEFHGLIKRVFILNNVHEYEKCSMKVIDIFCDRLDKKINLSDMPAILENVYEKSPNKDDITIGLLEAYLNYKGKNEK